MQEEQRPRVHIEYDMADQAVAELIFRELVERMPDVEVSANPGDVQQSSSVERDPIQADCVICVFRASKQLVVARTPLLTNGIYIALEEMLPSPRIGTGLDWSSWDRSSPEPWMSDLVRHVRHVLAGDQDTTSILLGGGARTAMERAATFKADEIKSLNLLSGLLSAAQSDGNAFEILVQGPDDDPFVRFDVEPPHGGGAESRLPWSTATAAWIALANALAQAEGNPEVHSAHLLTALLIADPEIHSEVCDSPAFDRIDTAYPDRTVLYEPLLEYVQRVDSYPNNDFWTDLLSVPDPPTYADFVHDSAAGPDLLGLGTEIRAFSQLVVSRDLAPPLAIGLFGDWGTGKSFFMQQMRERVRAFAASAEKKSDEPDYPWHSEVAQIEFNAWHYMDADLWPSLVVRIFEGLGEALSDEKKPMAEVRKELVEKLKVSEELRKEARAQLAKATALRTRKTELLQEATQARAEKGFQLSAVRLGDLKELLTDEQTKQVDELKQAALDAGIAADWTTIDEVRNGIEQLTSAPSRIEALLIRPATKPDAILRFGLLLVPMLLVPLVLAVLPGMIADFPEFIRDLSLFIAEVGAVLFPWVGALMWHVRLGHKALDHIAKNAVAVNRFLETQRQRLSDDEKRLIKELEELTAKESAAQRELLQAEEAFVAAKEASDAVDAGRRFFDFVRERSQSDDYRQREGVIALIRRDFERLADVLADYGETQDAKHRGIKRIILYIDDLDRCPPSRVVEVLQAVHLLLAYKLFVVVVAVDTRWLIRSVESHYDGLLQESTPQHYLEKIFQVPFNLQPMSSEGFGRLIDGITTTQTEESEAAQPVEAPTPEPSAHQTPAVRGTSTLTLIRKGEAPTPALMRLTVDEVESLKDLYPLVPSPRAAKRLVNTYQLLRAMIPEADHDAFLNGSAPGCAPILLFLALEVGSGDVARELQVWIDEHPEQPWEELLGADAAPVGGELWPDLVGCANAVRNRWGFPETLGETSGAAALVRRFSFRR